LTWKFLKIDISQKELRWQLGNPEREDLTLQLWIDAIEEERSKQFTPRKPRVPDPIVF
jgi:hypothetical protein